MEQEGGFVKLYRQMTKWEWYLDYPTFRVFTHLLLTANHKQEKWRGITIKRGQRLTSYSKLANECGLSIKQVRTAISNLKRTGELAYETTTRYGIATINNYQTYQAKGTPKGTQTAGRGQSRGSQGATNKNDKNYKNDKKKTVGVADISPEALKGKDPEDMTEEERQALRVWMLQGA